MLQHPTAIFSKRFRAIVDNDDIGRQADLKKYFKTFMEPANLACSILHTL
jgi:hypothetical protein